MSTTTTPAEQREDEAMIHTHEAGKRSRRERLQAGPDKAAILAYAEALADAEPSPARRALAYTDAALQAHEAARLSLYATLIAEAVGEDVWGAPIYSRDEVLTDYARTLDMGAGVANLRPTTLDELADRQRVPNVRLRRAYLKRADRGDELLSRLARAVESMRSGRPDGLHVRRLLGLDPLPNRPGYMPTLRLFMSYEQAVAMARVLQIPYHETGV